MRCGVAKGKKRERPEKKRENKKAQLRLHLVILFKVKVP